MHTSERFLLSLLTAFTIIVMAIAANRVYSALQHIEPIPESVGICGHVDIDRVYTNRQKDIAIVCVSNNGWVMRLPAGLDDNTYRSRVIPVIDSLRTEAKIRGIYEYNFDEQLMTW